MSWFTKVKEFFRGDSEDSTAQAAAPTISVPAPDPCQTTGPRRAALPPVLQNAGFSQLGGVQGLDWYKARLKQDSDGDIADEFLEESAMRPQRAGKHHRTVLQAQQLQTPAQLTNSSVVVSQGNVHVVLPKR